MELSNYLKKIIVPWSNKDWLPWEKEEWPIYLNLPDEMIAKFKELHKMGSDQMVEMGYSIKFLPETQAFKYGKLIKGTRHSCPLPTDEDDEAFLNVHCHPSGAAHSPADIATFKYTMKKSIFVAFVVAAQNLIYAVISRYNKSTLNSVNTNEMKRVTENGLGEYFDKRCPIPRQQREETIYGDTGLLQLDPHFKSKLQEDYKDVQLPKAEMFESRLITHYQELCRKITPGYEDYDTSLAEKNILSLKNHGFGIYKSDESTVGKLVCI